MFLCGIQLRGNVVVQALCFLMSRELFMLLKIAVAGAAVSISAVPVVPVVPLLGDAIVAWASVGITAK